MSKRWSPALSSTCWVSPVGAPGVQFRYAAGIDEPSGKYRQSAVTASCVAAGGAPPPRDAPATGDDVDVTDGTDDAVPEAPFEPGETPGSIDGATALDVGPDSFGATP